MLDALSRPKTLRESALEQLRDAVTLGHLKPGQRLVERTMGEQLGVSRTVIRECIRHLESERLVKSVPNVGPSVAVLDASEVEEIYEIRSMLETAAVRSCAERASDEAVTRLKEHCDVIAASLEDGDVIHALRETTRFYEVIFTEGRKFVSWDEVGRLNGRISRLRALTLGSSGRSSAGPRSLRKITAAIEKRDPDKAARACEQHIAEAARIALRELASQNQEKESGSSM